MNFSSTMSNEVSPTTTIADFSTFDPSTMKMTTEKSLNDTINEVVDKVINTKDMVSIRER